MDRRQPHAAEQRLRQVLDELVTRTGRADRQHWAGGSSCAWPQPYRFVAIRRPLLDEATDQAHFHLLLIAYNVVNWFRRFCLPLKRAVS